MEYLIYLATFAVIYILLAQSFNIIIGYTGLLNLAHTAFFGTGAYTAALLMQHGNSFGLSLLLAGLLGSVSGLLIGFPTLGLKKHYFAIATLGFSYIFFAVTINWTSLTRGPLGLPGIKRPYISDVWLHNILQKIHPALESQNLSFLLLAIIITSVCLTIIYRIVNSPFGKILETIREDEIAAQSLGKNTKRFKIASACIGAFFAGIAGGLFAIFIRYIDPYNFSLIEMTFILLMVVLGGMGSFTGSIIGAVLIVLLPEPLRFLNIDIFHELILISIGVIFLIKNPWPKRRWIKLLPFLLFFGTEMGIIMLKNADVFTSQAAHFTPLAAISLFSIGILLKRKTTRNIGYALLAAYLLGTTILLTSDTMFGKFPNNAIGPARQILFAILLIILMIKQPRGLLGREMIEPEKN